MITRIIFFLAFITTTGLSAQNTNPVSWSFEITESDGGHVVKATADIEDKWVVYSTYTEQGGPIPTSLEIEDVELIGSIIEEGKLIKEVSPLFEISVSKFKNSVTFVQAFKTASNQKELKGSIRFMTCDGEKCMPPKNVDFSLTL